MHRRSRAILAAATLAALVAATPPGARASPDFTGRGRSFLRYRTAIGRALARGPNLAGHYRLIEIGCGEGCVEAVLADTRTGRLSAFPIGGDDYFLLRLAYTPASPVVAARWQAPGPDVRCVDRRYVLIAGRFRRAGADAVARRPCPPLGD